MRSIAAGVSATMFACMKRSGLGEYLRSSRVAPAMILLVIAGLL